MKKLLIICIIMVQVIGIKLLALDSENNAADTSSKKYEYIVSEHSPYIPDYFNTNTFVIINKFTMYMYEDKPYQDYDNFYEPYVPFLYFIAPDCYDTINKKIYFVIVTDNKYDYVMAVDKNRYDKFKKGDEILVMKIWNFKDYGIAVLPGKFEGIEISNSEDLLNAYEWKLFVECAK